MNRLAPVLYIRSTIASSRANNKANNDIERTRVGSSETSEPSTTVRDSESEFTTNSLSGDGCSCGPRAVRRERSLPSMLRSSGSPFRGVELSGNTPAWVDDNPFETGIVESISVGSVPVHTPQLTDPIAPFMGFAMQAEVVKSTSKYTEFRKAQKRTFLDKACKAEESEGGLFFASRERGRNPQPDVSNSNEEHFSDEQPAELPPVDYLNVDIPDISIALPSTESSP